MNVSRFLELSQTGKVTYRFDLPLDKKVNYVDVQNLYNKSILKLEHIRYLYYQYLVLKGLPYYHQLFNIRKDIQNRLIEKDIQDIQNKIRKIKEEKDIPLQCLEESDCYQEKTGELGEESYLLFDLYTFFFYIECYVYGGENPYNTFNNNDYDSEYTYFFNFRIHFKHYFLNIENRIDCDLICDFLCVEEQFPEDVTIGDTYEDFFREVEKQLDILFELELDSDIDPITLNKFFSSFDRYIHHIRPDMFWDFYQLFNFNGILYSDIDKDLLNLLLSNYTSNVFVSADSLTTIEAKYFNNNFDWSDKKNTLNLIFGLDKPLTTKEIVKRHPLYSIYRHNNDYIEADKVIYFEDDEISFFFNNSRRHFYLSLTNKDIKYNLEKIVKEIEVLESDLKFVITEYFSNL